MKPFLNSLIKDQNGISVQIGNSFQMTDGNIDSPGSSPVTLSGGVDTIVIPEGAVEIILFPHTNNLQVSNVESMSYYDLVLKDAKESFPTARMQQVYVQGTGGDTLYYRFTIV